MMQFIKSRKKTVTLIIMAVIACLIIIKHHHSQQPMMNEKIPVEVRQAAVGNIPVQAHVIGTLVAAKHVQITPESVGHVAKMFFQDGGVFVKQGTPLVQLDDTASRAKLESDKANLTYSEVDYNRKVLLGKQGAISEQAIDQALADLKTKRAAV